MAPRSAVRLKRLASDAAYGMLAMPVCWLLSITLLFIFGYVIVLHIGGFLFKQARRFTGYAKRDKNG